MLSNNLWNDLANKTFFLSTLLVENPVMLSL
uniref:Uncharacterized protein n=1 Tax=Tetranychus urticae TaxID=32264 RepID=T1KKA8_TETUR